MKEVKKLMRERVREERFLLFSCEGVAYIWAWWLHLFDSAMGAAGSCQVYLIMPWLFIYVPMNTKSVTGFMKSGLYRVRSGGSFQHPVLSPPVAHWWIGWARLNKQIDADWCRHARG